MKKLIILLLCFVSAVSLGDGRGRYDFSSPNEEIYVAASNASVQAKDNADYICDGTGDEVEINAALATLTNGGRVTLSEGTFNIDAQISLLLSNQWLRGSGWGSIIIGSANLTGSERNMTMGTDSGGAITNVRVSDLFINTTVTTRGTYGIYIEDNVTYSMVDSCKITASFGGVLVDNTSKSIISNNYFTAMGDESIQTELSTEVLIVNNIIDTNGQRTPQAAVRLRGSEQITVSGNNISDCVAEGIGIERSQYCTIVGNTLNGNATNTSDAEISIVTAAGLTTKAIYNIISGNIINATTAAVGINETSHANVFSNVISNNVVRGAGITISSELSQAFGNDTDIEYIEQRNIVVKNTSGGTLAAGDVVIAGATGETYDGTQCILTTTAGDSRVLGMVVETIADDASGKVMTIGKTTALKADGTDDIAIGDKLSAFTTNKIAQKAAQGEVVFAMALEAYTTDDSAGVIDALLITPRQME